MKKENKSNPNLFIGSTIKILRVRMGMTQKQLAEKLNVSFQQVQKYENAKNQVGPDKLQMLASIFNCQISSFFPSTNNAPKLKAAEKERENVFQNQNISDPRLLKLMKSYFQMDENLKDSLIKIARGLTEESGDKK